MRLAEEKRVCYTNDMKKRDFQQSSKSGQTMVEYILAFCVLLGVVFAMGALTSALRANSERSLDLVASEYP